MTPTQRFEPPMTSDPRADLAGDLTRQDLERALELLSRGFTRETARIRELLRAALDRVVAFEQQPSAAGRADDAGAAPAAVTLLQRIALAAKAAEPRDAFLLIPFGAVEVERPLAGRSFEFTREHAAAAVAWFGDLGRNLAIDYEHQSLERFNTRGDGLRPAAGWIGGLEVRDDGLWAVNVRWTERAAELLRNGEYRYFSPVLYWADERCSELVGLGPVALTNDPAMHGVTPLAASRAAAVEAASTAGPFDVATQPGASASDDPFDNDERRPFCGLAEPDDADASGDSRDGALAAANAEVVLLRRQLALRNADDFVERGLRSGKITDATSMDWREDYLRDEAAAEARLARAPQILPPGRVLTPRDPQSPLRVERVVGTFAGSAAQLEAADLEVYEQALRCGRVIHVATSPRS